MGFGRRYLNAHDTAVYLGLADTDDPESVQRGVNALYQMVHRGEIVYIKFGRRLRFDIDDLDAMMDKNRSQPRNDGTDRNLERRGRTWYLRVMVDGKLHRRSTGFTDVTRARRRAAEIKASIREERLGWRTSGGSTFAEWARTFLASNRADKKKQAVLLRSSVVRWGMRPINGIQPSDIEEFFRERARNGATPGALDRERQLLRECFDAAITAKLLEMNPVQTIPPLTPSPQ